MAYRTPSDDEHSPSTDDDSATNHNNDDASKMVPASSSNDDPDSPTSRASARGTPNRASVDLPRSAVASKGGCWTCRLRRKKCDEQREGDSCKTCIRLKIKCLGWGPKRPEWMRDKAAVEAYKADIKAQLTRAGLIRGQPRASFANSHAHGHSSASAMGMGMAGPAHQHQQGLIHLQHGNMSMHAQQPRTPYHRHTLPEVGPSSAGPSSYAAGSSSNTLDFSAAFPFVDQHGRSAGGGGGGHPPPMFARHNIIPGMPGGSNSIFDTHLPQATYSDPNLAALDPSTATPFFTYSPHGTPSGGGSSQHPLGSSSPNPGSLTGTPSIGGTTPSLGGTASLGGTTPALGGTASLAGTPGIGTPSSGSGVGAPPLDFVALAGESSGFVFAPVAALRVPTPPPEQHAVQTEHVIWYFDRVRRLQFTFAGHAVTNITYSLIVQEPRGAVTNAVCALASLHYTQMRVSQGLESLDPNPEFSTARYFHDEALCQLINAKEVRGHYVDADAIAALHLVSFSLFSGGATSWRQPLGIACDWLARTSLLTDENPKMLLFSMQPIEQLIVKTTMWFDIFASITQQQPPRFFNLWKRLLAPVDRNAFWNLRGGADLNMQPANQGGLQMDALSGCPDEALLALAETAALAHWKVNQQSKGSLSVRELVRRGDEIEAALRANVSELTTASGSDTEAPLHTGLSGTGEGSGQTGSAFPGEDMRLVAANLFRESAVLYTRSIVNGPNPGVPEISAAVDTVVHLLQQLPGSDVDRALVLPICLAGCLTDNSPQRDYLKNRLQARDEGFGNVMQTRLLMESVWRKRDVTGGSVDWRQVAGERGPTQVPLLV